MSSSSCSSPVLAVRGGRSDLEAYGANISEDNKTSSRRTTASQLGSAKPRSLAATYTGASSTSNNTITNALAFFDGAARTTTPSPAGTPQKKNRLDIPSASSTLDGAVQGCASFVSLSTERGHSRGGSIPALEGGNKPPSCAIIRGNGALAVAVPVTITAPPIPSLSLRPSSKNLRSLVTPVAKAAHISPCAHNTWVGHHSSNDTVNVVDISNNVHTHPNSHVPLAKHSAIDHSCSSSSKAAASIPPPIADADTCVPSSSWHHTVNKDAETKVVGSHGGGGSPLVFKSEGSGSIPRGRISGGTITATAFDHTSISGSIGSSGHPLLGNLPSSTTAVAMPLSLRTEALSHSSKREMSPNVGEKGMDQQPNAKEESLTNNNHHDSDQRTEGDERGGGGTAHPTIKSSSRSASRHSCIEGSSGTYSSAETHTTAGINTQSGARVVADVKIKNCPHPSAAAAAAADDGHKTESFVPPHVSSSSPLSSSFSSYYSSSSSNSSSSSSLLIIGEGNADTPCTRKIRRNERKRRRRKELEEKKRKRRSVVTCEPDSRATEGSTVVCNKMKQPCENGTSTASEAASHQPEEKEENEKGERGGIATVRAPEVANIQKSAAPPFSLSSSSSPPEPTSHPHPHPPSAALATTKGPERRPYVTPKATKAAGENKDEGKVAVHSERDSSHFHPRNDGEGDAAAESSEEDDADDEGAAGALLYSTSCYTYSEEVEHSKSEDGPRILKNTTEPPPSKKDDSGEGHANSQPRVCRQNILIVPTLHPDAAREELVVPMAVVLAGNESSLAREIDIDKDKDSEEEEEEEEKKRGAQFQELSDEEITLSSSTRRKKSDGDDEPTVAEGGGGSDSGPTGTISLGVTDGPIRSISPMLLDRTYGQQHQQLQKVDAVVTGCGSGGERQLRSPSRSRASVVGAVTTNSVVISCPMKKRSASTVRESASALRGAGRGTAGGVGVSVVGGGGAAPTTQTKAGVGGGGRASTAALPNTRGSLVAPPLGVSGSAVSLGAVRQSGVVERERRVAPPPQQQRNSRNTAAFGRGDSTIAKARRRSTEANHPEVDSCAATTDKTTGSQRSSPLLNNSVPKISAAANAGDRVASVLLPSPPLTLATPCGVSGKQQTSSASGSGGGTHSSSAASNPTPQQRNVPPSKVVAGAPKSVPPRPGVKESFQNQKAQQGGNVSSQQQQRHQKGITAANNSRQDQQQASHAKDKDTGNNNNNQRLHGNPLTSGGHAPEAAKVPINKWVSAAGLTEHDLRRIRIYMLNTMLREEAEAVWAGEAEGDRIDGV